MTAIEQAAKRAALQSAQYRMSEAFYFYAEANAGQNTGNLRKWYYCTAIADEWAELAAANFNEAAQY